MTGRLNDRAYLAELNPQFRLIVDELPPLGTKILMRTLWGPLIIGPYHPEYQIVAWMPLPKFQPEQRRRLDAMVAAGVDPTVHPGLTYHKQPFKPLPCAGGPREHTRFVDGPRTGGHPQDERTCVADATVPEPE